MTTSSLRPADNPFASHRVEALPYRGASLSWHKLEQRIESLGSRAAIVGPKGSGKTTLLEALARNLPGPVLKVRIPGSDSHPVDAIRNQLPRSVEAKHTVLIDGAEQLGAIAWRRFLHTTREARSMLVTLHRPGRLPTLFDCTTDVDLLRKLVTDLAPDRAASLEPTLEDLFRRHEGNIRLCLRELYDVFAGRAFV